MAKETFADYGVSAFSGANRLKGDLATFIRLAKEKKLKPNPVLLLEEWSRFSRQDIDESETAILDLLRNGIAIHIHFSNKTYTKQSINTLGDKIEIIVSCKAAYDYSSNLSKRIAKAYEKKKEAFANGTIKAYRFRCPGWLRWNKDTQCYDPIPERVASIKRIFQLACNGLGIRRIARELNREINKYPIIGTYKGRKIKSKHWAESTIMGIIQGGAVLGKNDAMDGKMMFPSVIDEKTYYRAHEVISHRKTHHYYGKNERCDNLFQGIATCSVCGKAMVLHTQRISSKRHLKRYGKNFGKRGGIGARGGTGENKYLWCSGYYARTCSSKQVIYDAIEESFFPLMTDPHFRDTITGKVYGTNDNDTENESVILKGKLEETRKRLAKMASDYDEQPSATLAGLMAKTEQIEKELLRQIAEAKTIELGSTPATQAYGTLQDLLTPKHSKEPDWDNPETRFAIREAMRALVDRIRIDIKQKSYDVFLKYGKDVPVHVQLYRNGFKVDGKFYCFHRNMGIQMPFYQEK